MSTGADNKTMPGTAEFRDGYDRIFGERKPVRGTWVWDAAQGKLVPLSEYVPPVPEPTRVPVVGDAHYDGLRATDGTPIDSRTKHRRFMKERGLTTADDFTETWAKAKTEREDPTGGDHKRRREAIERALYKMDKP